MPYASSILKKNKALFSGLIIALLGLGAIITTPLLQSELPGLDHYPLYRYLIGLCTLFFGIYTFAMPSLRVRWFNVILALQGIAYGLLLTYTLYQNQLHFAYQLQLFLLLGWYTLLFRKFIVAAGFMLGLSFINLMLAYVTGVEHGILFGTGLLVFSVVELLFILIMQYNNRTSGRSLLMLRQAQQVTNSGYWRYSFRSRLVEYSDNAWCIMGLQAHEEATLETLHQIIAPQYRQLHQDALARMAQGSEKEHLEYCIVLPDGAQRYIRSSIYAEYSTHGVRSAYFATIQDISEQKATEYALQQTKILLENIVDSLPLAITVKEVQSGNYIFANKTARSFLEISPQALPTLADIERILPANTVNTIKSMEAYIAKQKEGDIVSKDIKGHSKGREVYCRFNKCRFSSPVNNKQYILTTVEDITRKRNDEERLRTSESYLRVVLDNTEQSIILLSPEGNILTLNRTAKIHSESYCTKPLEPGMRLKDYMTTTEAEHNFEMYFNRALKGERVVVEKMQTTKSNIPYWNHLSYIPIAEEEEINSVVLIIHDITRRKRNEEKLLASFNDLHKAKEELQVREAYLQIIASIEFLLIADAPLHIVYQQVCNQLGKYGMADRVVIFENTWNNNMLTARRMTEWHGSDITSILHEPGMKEFDYNEAMPNLLSQVQNENMVVVHTNQCKEPERTIFAERDIKTLIIVPIRNDEKFYGFIALDFCKQEHYPESSELDFYQVIVSSLSVYISRYEINRKLQTAETMYRQMLDAIEDLVVLRDKESRIVWANRNFRERFELSEDMIGAKSRLTDELSQRYQSYDSIIRSTKTSIDLVETLPYRGGVEEKFQTINNPIFDENGGVAMVVGVSRNIDLQMEREKAIESLLVKYRKINIILKRRDLKLRKSRQRLKLLAENSSEMIALNTPDGVITYLSPSSERLTGYKRQEMYGKSLVEFFHPEDLEVMQVESQKQLTRDNNEITLTHRFLTKSGSYIWLDSIIKYIFDESGKVISLQSSSRDVSTREEAQRALLESEAKYRMLFNSGYHIILISNGITILNPNVHFIEANAVAVSKLGYSYEEICAMKPHQIEVPISDEERRQRAERLIQTGQTNFETTFICKNGTLIPMEVVGTFVNFKGIKAVQIIAQDITERRQAEASAKARAIAEQELRFKSEFLANMSHEIRTPMNGIIGMTRFLLNSPLNEQQQRYASTIQLSATNLLQILNDILDLSKLEAGKINLRLGEFNYKVLLDSLIGLFSSPALQQNVELSATCEPDLPEWIIADQQRLSQVLTNLISNAIKFSPMGKVRIHTALKPLSGQSLLRISVSDTGIGIDEVHQAMLFDKFYQVESDLHNKSEGTGLGLAICKQLVELWQGEIGVESQPGAGSTFWFTMPFERSGQRHKRNEGVAVTNVSSSYFNIKVLLVEDKLINQEVARIMLEEAGASVNIASNGQIAIDMLRQQQYDLILMDIQMPVMDGITATQLIKKEFKNTPPIFGLSANAMEGDAEKYIAMGMDDYIAKPLDPEVLFYKIKRWLPEKTFAQPILKNAEVPIPVAREDLLNTSLHQKLLQMAGGNTGHINILFDSFVADMQELSADMHKALDEHNTELLRSALHTAKGLSGTIGATALYELCKSLYVKMNESTEVNEDLSVQIDYFDHLLKLTSEQMKI